jgi:hypothetical protein
MAHRDTELKAQLLGSSPILGSLSEVSHRGAVDGKLVAIPSSAFTGRADLSRDSRRMRPIRVQHGIPPYAGHGIHQDQSL